MFRPFSTVPCLSEPCQAAAAAKLLRSYRFFLSTLRAMSERVSRPVARYRPGQAPARPVSDSSDDETPAAPAPAPPRERLPSKVTSAARTAGVPIPAAAAPAPAPGGPVDLDEYGTCVCLPQKRIRTMMRLLRLLPPPLRGQRAPRLGARRRSPARLHGP